MYVQEQGLGGAQVGRALCAKGCRCHVLREDGTKGRGWLEQRTMLLGPPPYKGHVKEVAAREIQEAY